eukprot:1997140-Alexandrium_andersonii.AAC.1
MRSTGWCDDARCRWSRFCAPCRQIAQWRCAGAGVRNSRGGRHDFMAINSSNILMGGDALGVALTPLPRRRCISYA